MKELMEMYNRHPLEELVIHPRVQREFEEPCFDRTDKIWRIVDKTAVNESA